jgi:hypothetical protein
MAKSEAAAPKLKAQANRTYSRQPSLKTATRRAFLINIVVASGHNPPVLFKIGFRAEKPTRLKMAGRTTKSAQSLSRPKIFERF